MENTKNTEISAMFDDPVYRVLVSIEQQTTSNQTGRIVGQRQIGEQLEVSRWANLNGASEAVKVIKNGKTTYAQVQQLEEQCNALRRENERYIEALDRIRFRSPGPYGPAADLEMAQVIAHQARTVVDPKQPRGIDTQTKQTPDPVREPGFDRVLLAKLTAQIVASMASTVHSDRDANILVPGSLKVARKIMRECGL